MTTGNRFIWLSGFLVLAFPVAASAQEDAKGCTDHPFFSRMPNYYLAQCRTWEFDSNEFYDPATQGKTKITAEGKKYYLSYSVKREFYDKYASTLQIIRNHENAVKKAGGTTYSWTNISGGEVHARYAKDGLETWARVYINGRGAGYTITLVEKGQMKQDVVSDAKAMANDITATGKTVIYGIYFDFNKAEIMPESRKALQEIAALLKQDGKVKMFVVGHTDNAGGYEYNAKLSLRRAEAVVKELVAQYKIASDRLQAEGVGLLCPVASNDTEEGRARNRRVELVKQ
ncbi:MAG: OmpA family protein [Bryobacterales bacterium]|jgi:outer membrane protein OmpA-like peptidoglycan-associated protein|nr:OmpA family protein [Bryobacterales bacterium]